MEQPEIPKEQQLKSYFQTQIPVRRVYVEWKIDSHSFRFYFDDEHEYRYILDLDQGLLQRRSVTELIQELERADWKRILHDHSEQLVRFSDGGFTFQAR